MEKTRFFRASTDRGVVVATIQVAPRNIRILRDCAGVAAALLIISIFSYYRLLGTPWQIDFSAAFQGIRPVLGATFFAALKIWTFWALTAAVIAGIQLKLDPGIDSFDALLGGVAGAWMAAYILGQVLGPIGLFRAPVIWILLIASGAWIFFTPTQFVMPRLTPGRAMAMLAFALVMVGLIPLQLGSPAAPYMDVMSYPASVQRILSFGRYLPFDNDPYGCWGPQAQTPGLELFLAMLAMGSRVKLGLLAHSATIVPMAGLIIFGAYRLGAATLGDAAGGVASLMLFFTNTFRRAVGVRGTAVAFALVGVGLGLVLDRRARRSTFALGCLILGAAVASHTIDGGFAIAVASFAILLRDATRPQILLLKGVCLFGSVLVAAPDLAISTKTVLAYPILPMLQIAGIGAIVFAARALPEPELGDDESPSAYDPRSYNVAMFAIFLVVLAYTLTRVPDSIYAQIFQQFPLLSAFAAMGLFVIGTLRGRDAKSIDGSPLIIALLVTIVVEMIARKLGSMEGSAAFHAGIDDLHYKLDEYWTPYFLVFPAALPFAVLFHRGRRAVVVIAVLAILIYPWNPRPNGNYDYEEHSISENWGIDISTAGRGYWGSTPDPKWTMGPDELALVDVLQDERKAGRITMKTHVLHIANDAIVWRQFNRFSVYTGIDDDPIVQEIPSSDVGWLAGGRVRQMAELPEALAQKPPYILIQVPPPDSVKFPPDDYDKIFERGALQLYRRHDLTPPGAAPRALSPQMRITTIADLKRADQS